MEIWRDWNISDWCSYGGFATLWTSAFKMLKGHGNFDYLNWVFVRHRENWIAAEVILLIGFVLGWVIKAITYFLKIILRKKYERFVRAEEKRLLLLNSGNPITHQKS